MKVMSEEWWKAFEDKINSNKAYEEAASWWEGDFLFEIQPGGPFTGTIKAFVGLLHGKCTGSKVINEGDPVPDVEFIVSGTYDNWLKVLQKELDPIQGMMAGKLRLTGNMAKIMRAVKAAQELVNSTTMIENVEFY